MQDEYTIRTLITFGVVTCIVLFAVAFVSPAIPFAVETILPSAGNVTGTGGALTINATSLSASGGANWTVPPFTTPGDNAPDELPAIIQTVTTGTATVRSTSFSTTTRPTSPHSTPPISDNPPISSWTPNTVPFAEVQTVIPLTTGGTARPTPTLKAPLSREPETTGPGTGDVTPVRTSAQPTGVIPVPTATRMTVSTTPAPVNTPPDETTGPTVTRTSTTRTATVTSASTTVETTSPRTTVPLPIEGPTSPEPTPTGPPTPVLTPTETPADEPTGTPTPTVTPTTTPTVTSTPILTDTPTPVPTGTVPDPTPSRSPETPGTIGSPLETVETPRTPLHEDWIPAGVA